MKRKKTNKKEKDSAWRIKLDSIRIDLKLFAFSDFESVHLDGFRQKKNIWVDVAS